MSYREADGGDKIAAFERGASDAEMHLAFETPGVTAYVVQDAWLVAVKVHGPTLSCVYRKRLYEGRGEVGGFLGDIAESYGCTFIADQTA